MPTRKGEGENGKDGLRDVIKETNVQGREALGISPRVLDFGSVLSNAVGHLICFLERSWSLLEPYRTITAPRRVGIGKAPCWT